MSNKGQTKCVVIVSLIVWQKGIGYQPDCVTNMKLFLKIIENKPKFSECELQCLIECQTKVKLNVSQMWAWVFNNKEVNIKVNVSECITNMKFFLKMIEKIWISNESQMNVKLSLNI